MRLFDVYAPTETGDLKLIDTVYFENDCTSETVRHQLIQDPYCFDESIVVVEYAGGGTLD